VKKFFMSVGALAACAALAGALPAAGTTPVAKKGDIVYGTLQQTLNSKTNHDNDPFQLSQKDSFFHHNPALHGGVIEGHLENVSPAGPTHKATMSIIFDDVKLPDGSTAPFHAQVLSLKDFEPKTHLFRDTAIVVGGAVTGHMLAGKAGMKHGGVAGAAAGFALASTMKSDINVKQGTVVKLKLSEDVVPAAGSPSS